MNRIDLQNRVAVIAGVASAVGAAVCARFAISGARVVAWDGDPQAARRTAEALPAGGALARGGRGPEAGTHGFAVVDLTDATVVELAVTDTVARFGRIDILVCAAGMSAAGQADGPAASGSRRALDLAMHGTLLCAQAVSQRMAAQGYGRIVNVAATAGDDGPQSSPRAHASAAAQAAVIGLTRTLGAELAGSGVRIACVATKAQRAPVLDAMTRQHIDQMLAGIPLGRPGPADDVASIIAWLASEDCTVANGTVVHLDDGPAARSTAPA